MSETTQRKRHATESSRQAKRGRSVQQIEFGLKPLMEVDDGKSEATGGINNRNGGTRTTKKLVLKNFHQRRNEQALSFDTNWSMLENAVRGIQSKTASNAMFEVLFVAVEALCTHNHAEDIYKRVIQLFHDYLNRRLVELPSADPDHVTFLVALDSFWRDYCDQLGMVQSIFTYLDRTYVLQNPAIQAIWEAGLTSFRESVVECPTVSKRLVPNILEVVKSERDGNQVNRQLLQSLVRMFLSLKIYDDVFEPELIITTDAYYKAEAARNIESLEIGDYLKHVAKRLDEESERVDFYFSYRSLQPLQECADRCFIEDFMTQILAKGADTLFHENKTDELKLMYRLFGRTKEGHNNLKTAFVNYIKKVGRVMVMSTEAEKSLVPDLMQLKRTLDRTVLDCFDNNERFVQGEKDAFDVFINTRPNKPAELIAKYMDSKLRMGNKECSEDELDAIMDDVIVLFRFIQGKDVFEAFYKKSLAKRLLMGRSASVDSEKAMLSKLKNECGAGFTQRLEGMFKDMEVSRELSAAFHQQRQAEAGAAEFEVSVLTMGHWPTYAPMAVRIPAGLQAQEARFERFYTAKHNGRKLLWQHSLASAILKAHFGRGVRKELDMSMFQALVLLLFNQRVRWAYADIARDTGIEDTELKRTLQSLACGKFRLLVKEPKGKDVAESDEFVFNDNFNHALFRIRISQVLMKETESEHKQTEEQVNQDRQYEIDAAVVRIMKTRKVLAHNLLLSELFHQLRFPAKPIDLKKRIESLIDREYMCRDKQDAQIYHYVA